MIKLKQINKKIKLFEKKYGQTLVQFENKIKQSKNEDFEEWDNLIEWEAYNHFQEQLTKTINDSRNNNHWR
ncbi:MAG: hypothetical protein B6D64_13925 [Bacteroidetes bacterium 4484_276]|nr:MAG: hypothetical protein B6D64_13925 [Bacteroidetes bacterium 4484_276]